VAQRIITQGLEYIRGDYGYDADLDGSAYPASFTLLSLIFNWVFGLERDLGSRENTQNSGIKASPFHRIFLIFRSNGYDQARGICDSDVEFG